MTSYGQFCPVAKAADVLGQRWAILVVRELLAGSTRFGDIQRGVPGCPPATLAKRLRELTAAGVVDRVDGAYALTEAGAELYPIVEGLGRWGQRWARSAYPNDELDPDMLLWDLRRFLDPVGLGVDEAVVQLDLRLPRGRPRRYWIVVEPGSVDLCLTDPERAVDVVVDADLRTLTQVWMGDVAFDDTDIVVQGPRPLVRRLPAWIGRHPVLGSIPIAAGA